MMRQIITSSLLFCFCFLLSGLHAQSNRVILYSDCDYQGGSRDLYLGSYRSSQLGIGNDQLSSLQIPSGLQVTLYADDNFGGISTVVTSDASCLAKQWSNSVSSIRVAAVNSSSGGSKKDYIASSGGYGNDYHNNEYNANDVILYVDADYRGSSRGFSVGNYPSLSRANFPNDALSSLRIPRGYEVIIYEHENFGGRSYRLSSSLPRIVFNDAASSMKIIRNY